MFTITVENMDSGHAIDGKNFDDKKDAKTFVKIMIKKHKLTRHAGYIVNYSDRKELFTNF